jgi:Na+/melibiose symporter-like transporter
MKLNYKQTMLIGLGFFTVSIVWGIYNIAMPIYLDDLGLSGLAVGAVMTIDNIFAVIFLPIFGALSDRTNTRYGRRMPYLLVGIPLSALAFILIPVLRMSLLPMMITVIAMNFFMSIYRAPTVALMPDFTPRPLRSKANGVINFMGGVGAVIAFLIGGFLFRLNEYLPFAVCSGIMMLTIIVMYLKIREPMEIAEDKPDVPDEGTASVPKDKGVMLSLIFLLLAIFFWFVDYNAVENFFSMTAAILSPVLFGFIKDLMGDSILFIYSSIAMVLAFFFMMLVKHGESEVKQKASLQE